MQSFMQYSVVLRGRDMWVHVATIQVDLLRFYYVAVIHSFLILCSDAIEGIQFLKR